MQTWTGRHKGKTPYRVATTTDLLTPPCLLAALGALRETPSGDYTFGRDPFDLDPCASRRQPWPTARTMFTRRDNGFDAEWEGEVWLNPPYGRDLYAWLALLASHGNGMALCYARTDTQGFDAHVWGRADAVYFFTGRLFFHKPITGRQCPANCGGPTVLVCYGAKSVERAGRLPGGDYPGHLVPVKRHKPRGK